MLIVTFVTFCYLILRYTDLKLCYLLPQKIGTSLWYLFRGEHNIRKITFVTPKKVPSF